MTFQKLLNCIVSCETLDQLEVTRELINRVCDGLIVKDNTILNIALLIKERSEFKVDAETILQLSTDIYERGEYDYFFKLTNPEA